MAVVSPPRLVGTAAVADFYGVSRFHTIYAGLAAGRAPYTIGYLGKIGGRHCWDFNQIVETGGDLPCQVCGEPAGVLRLCPDHARLFLRSWSRHERSRISLIQFVSLCRWVSDHWQDVIELQVDDLWSATCVTPGCDGEANQGHQGPLCASCAAEVHRHLNRACTV